MQYMCVACCTGRVNVLENLITSKLDLILTPLELCIMYHVHTAGHRNDGERGLNVCF